jgi:hypothetical protein
MHDATGQAMLPRALLPKKTSPAPIKKAGTTVGM